MRSLDRNATFFFKTHDWIVAEVGKIWGSTSLLINNQIQPLIQHFIYKPHSEDFFFSGYFSKTIFHDHMKKKLSLLTANTEVGFEVKKMDSCTLQSLIMFVMHAEDLWCQNAVSHPKALIKFSINGIMDFGFCYCNQEAAWWSQEGSGLKPGI